MLVLRQPAPSRALVRRSLKNRIIQVKKKKKKASSSDSDLESGSDVAENVSDASGGMQLVLVPLGRAYSSCRQI